MSDDRPPAAEVDLAFIARLNGVELTAAEVDALRPAYVQMRGWLAALRRAVPDDEEPATIFVAVKDVGHGTA